MASDVRIGMLVRAARRRLRLRQADVAARAGVCQQTVSHVECGRLTDVGLRTARRIAQAVEVDLEFAARFRGATGDRLLDSRHATLVDAVVERLRERGWAVDVEWSFNRYGERGSVDVLGWREDRLALLIVEVKSELVDVQELLRSLDRKRRLVPGELARARGRRAASVGVVLVLPDERGRRAGVTRHASTFDAVLPARTVAVRTWLAAPSGGLRGIWFVHSTHQGGGMQRLPAPERVRLASRRREAAGPRSNRGERG